VCCLWTQTVAVLCDAAMARDFDCRRMSLWLNNLNGTIPESLGSLTGLTALDLYDNELTGTIPESLGSLTGLT
jgi:hypothetical protein